MALPRTVECIAGELARGLMSHPLAPPACPSRSCPVCPAFLGASPAAAPRHVGVGLFAAHVGELVALALGVLIGSSEVSRRPAGAVNDGSPSLSSKLAVGMGALRRWRGAALAPEVGVRVGGQFGCWLRDPDARRGHLLQDPRRERYGRNSRPLGRDLSPSSAGRAMGQN